MMPGLKNSIHSSQKQAMWQIPSIFICPLWKQNVVLTDPKVSTVIVSGMNCKWIFFKVLLVCNFFQWSYVTFIPGDTRLWLIKLPWFAMATLLKRIFQVVLVVKNPPANAGDIREAGSIPESGRSPGEGHGNPLQCSCLENPMDRGAWRATVHRVAKSRTRQKWLSTHTRAHTHF